jgi:hypothetical protein
LYDENDVRYPTPVEKAEMEARRADIAAQKAQVEAKRADSELAARVLAEQRVSDLLEQMRKMGIDPDAMG